MLVATAAKNLHALAEFVVPLIPRCFLPTCVRNNPHLAETGGPPDTALHYAELVKDEAVDGFTHEEAVACSCGAQKNRSGPWTRADRGRSVLLAAVMLMGCFLFLETSIVGFAMAREATYDLLLWSTAGMNILEKTGITRRLQTGDSNMPPTMTHASGC